MVYLSGQGRVVPDIHKDPDFVDVYQPPRTALPYRSILLTPIYSYDEQTKLGIFCLDSSSYTFTSEDLELVAQVAIRIGWLMGILAVRELITQGGGEKQ